MVVMLIVGMLVVDVVHNMAGAVDNVITDVMIVTILKLTHVGMDTAISITNGVINVAVAVATLLMKTA